MHLFSTYNVFLAIFLVSALAAPVPIAEVQGDGQGSHHSRVKRIPADLDLAPDFQDPEPIHFYGDIMWNKLGGHQRRDAIDGDVGNNDVADNAFSPPDRSGAISGEEGSVAERIYYQHHGRDTTESAPFGTPSQKNPDKRDPQLEMPGSTNSFWGDILVDGRGNLRRRNAPKKKVSRPSSAPVE